MAEDTELTPLDMSFLDNIPHTYRLLASGGIAGCVAKTITAPLSRITILFQVNSAMHAGERPQYASGLLPAMRRVMREEGFLAFWKGNGTSVLHRFPYAGINFFCYEHFKLAFANTAEGGTGRRSETPFTRLVAGACAGGVACSACYPLDLIRTRLTIQDGQHKEYQSIADAFAKIARREGFWGLYKGLGTTLMVAVPNLAISYCIYGTMKEVMYTLKFPDRDVQGANTEEPRFVDSLVCGATSGICSSLITYPADVLRRRLQVRGLQQPGEPVGPWAELMDILRREGPRGLYRGLTPEILKVVPMVATTFTTYELLKQQLGV